MRLFFKQVKLLLWKNFSTRKRQIFRNVAEFCWPLAIFIILAWVRTRKPPENVPLSKGPLYYSPRALPSAGIFPFAQSLFCNYSVNKIYSKPQTIPDISNTFAYVILEGFGSILSDPTKMKAIEQLPQDISEIAEDLERIYEYLNEIVLPFGDLINKDQMISSLGLTQYTASSLVHGNIKVSAVVTYAESLLRDLNSMDLQIGTDAEQILKTYICKENGLFEIIQLPSNFNRSIVAADICSKSLVNLTETLAKVLQANWLQISFNLQKIEQARNVESIVFKLQAKVLPVINEIQSFSFVQDLLQRFSQLLEKNDLNTLLHPRFLLCGSTDHASNSAAIVKQPSNETETYQQTVCPIIHSSVRLECGWKDINKNQCYRLNCCYDSSTAKPCYCTTTNASSCCYKRAKLINRVATASGYTPQMVDSFTEMLEGKILYSPKNGRTQELVEKIESFIMMFTDPLQYQTDIESGFGTAMSFIKLLMNNTDVLNEVNKLVPLLESPYINRLLDMVEMQPLIPKELREGLKQFRKYLPEYRKFLNSTHITNETLEQVQKTARDVLIAFREIVDDVSCFNISNMFLGFETEKELIDYAIHRKNKVNFLSSVVFLNLHDDKPFPKKLRYKLRFNPDYTPSTSSMEYKFWKPGPTPRGTLQLWEYKYINFGFVFLQDLIERTFLEIWTNGTVSEPGIYIQEFPYPCYIKDLFIAALGNSMPLFMILAWVYSISMTIKSIVYEKETRLKEIMKVMGLTDAVHWTAWYITSFGCMFISILLLVVLLKVGDILIHSDSAVITFVLCIFANASIALAFLISVFFSNANISAASGGLIYFFTYLPYPITIWFEGQMGFSAKSVVSLLSTTSFGLCFKYISRWEEQGIGAQWSNFYDSPIANDSFSLGWAVNFMVIDCLIYTVFIWYFEKVFPGEFGIKKEWYFPFTKSYWSSIKVPVRRRSPLNVYNRMEEPVLTTDDVDFDFSEMQDRFDFTGKFEKEPSNLNIGVHIQNLVKVYKRGNKRAVDGLNLKFYKEQVTTLLGHNGAGKSTTMSVLTGLFPPTSGTALVNGFDIRTDMESIRKTLGLCPQHNVLFDLLTVEEHMWFYATMKGMTKDEIQPEIERFLVSVGLENKRSELSSNLSGGMKRKLSVAMAFIANSKTVILDEPTSGVDPYSRRSIWDLILRYKQGRTILLSTHYMDEADILGDRISIISNGRLQCSGSPLFLKHVFGKGYFLTVTCNQEDEGRNADKILHFIKSFVPGSVLNETFGGQLTFLLPSSARLTGEFENLFENLEDCVENLGIKSYGVSDTTLEEVFLQACNENSLPDEDSIPMMGQSRRMPHDDQSFSSVNSIVELLPMSTENQSNTNCAVTEPAVSLGSISTGSLYLRQYVALLIKRFHHARRSWKGFFSQIVLPSIFVIVAMSVSLIHPSRLLQPSLELSTKMFSKPNYVIVQMQNKTKYAEKLMKYYVEYPATGYDCTNSSCLNMNKTFKEPATPWKQRHCSCKTGKNLCTGDVPQPPSLKSVTGDTILNMSGHDFNSYILGTTDTFIGERYGGATFGLLERQYPGLDSMTNDPVKSLQVKSLVSVFGVKENVKVWYNLKGYHALPTYINMMNNAILRSRLPPGEDPAEYGIVAYNHPMEFNMAQIEDEIMREGITDLFVAIFVIVALAFVPASFIVYLVHDRVSKSKHLQLVTGLNPIVYWLANLSWDLINFLIPTTCCLIIFAAFDLEAYISNENLPSTILLLLLYGWAMTPLMYPMSFVFDVPSTAYIVLIAANLFVGIVGTVATFILEYIGDDDEELLHINTVLKQVLLIFPNYAMGRGLIDLASNQLRADIYLRVGQSAFKDPMSWDVIGRNICAMAIGGFVYFLITLLCQYNFFVRFRSRSAVKAVNSQPKHQEDDDVANEDEMIGSDKLKGMEFVLETQNLSKVYRSRGNKKVQAVDRLTFGVKQGECFGLLGVNGAGKTSTFKMLTGDTKITGGDALVKGHSVRHHMNQVRRHMGYCPQFDALDELVTGKELLLYYARLRGYRGEGCEKMANWAIETLDLTQYQHKRCGDYSGGNKRKLSTAIALLGSPPLIFLDEPTTGMDPRARRFLWNVINSLLKSGKSVVFTSHSMEECETLCSRLAIMVNGEFKCLGSPQHLKSKFGMGYTIVIRSKQSSVNSVDEFLKQNFAGINLKDRHHNMLEYQVPMEGLKLSHLFHKLELLRKNASIEEYSLSQTTLDQIFVNFARLQVEAVEVKKHTIPTMEVSDVTTRNVIV